MRLLIAMMTSAGLLLPAQGADCALGNARYAQPGSEWTIAFHAVPPDAPSNQTAAFTLRMPRSNAAMEGGVYQPNGYSSSRGSLEGPCEPGGDAKKTQELCRFWEAVLYAGTSAGIAVLSDDDTTPAPEQILLPELGAAMWYSSYREEFTETEADPGDVFTFKDCAP